MQNVPNLHHIINMHKYALVYNISGVGRWGGAKKIKGRSFPNNQIPVLNIVNTLLSSMFEYGQHENNNKHC